MRLKGGETGALPQAPVEHTVTPDDRAQARSTRVLSDLRTQLECTYHQDDWLGAEWSESVAINWSQTRRRQHV